MSVKYLIVVAVIIGTSQSAPEVFDIIKIVNQTVTVLRTKLGWSTTDLGEGLRILSNQITCMNDNVTQENRTTLDQCIDEKMFELKTKYNNEKINSTFNIEYCTSIVQEPFGKCTELRELGIACFAESQKKHLNDVCEKEGHQLVSFIKEDLSCLLKKTVQDDLVKCMNVSDIQKIPAMNEETLCLNQTNSVRNCLDAKFKICSKKPYNLMDTLSRFIIDDKKCKYPQSASTSSAAGLFFSMTTIFGALLLM